MTPQEASALLVYARQHDHLVVDTDAQAHTWATHLEHVPVSAGRLIVSDYYGRHSDPDRRKPIDASVIRKLYSSKAREVDARSRALDPPSPKPRTGPPPHIKAKLDAFRAKHAKK
ncbi:hypothetical protein [Nesterenkonia pannonica]|uniref:hypothetical protein n=1 Tax=Nesterenkonia pannonica TaxID=1548602 RepID=UPI0021648711|nr:hypothetical protein [Nesterenkonia pannonica]